MRKFLLILAGIAMAVVMFAAAVVSLIWLTSTNENAIIVVNDSKTVLHNASLAVAGMPDSQMESVSPKEYFGQTMPAGKKVPFRLVFDGDTHHYEFPSEARALPFGSWSVIIHVDEKMQFSIKVHGPF